MLKRISGKGNKKRYYIAKNGVWDDANYPRIAPSTGVILQPREGHFLLVKNSAVNMAFRKSIFKNFRRVRFVFRMDIEIGRSPARLKMLSKYPIIQTYNEPLGQGLVKVSKQNVYYSFEYDFETMDIDLPNVQLFFWECTNNAFAHESTAKLYDVWFEDATYK